MLFYPDTNPLILELRDYQLQPMLNATFVGKYCPLLSISRVTLPLFMKTNLSKSNASFVRRFFLIGLRGRGTWTLSTFQKSKPGICEWCEKYCSKRSYIFQVLLFKMWEDIWLLQYIKATQFETQAAYSQMSTLWYQDKVGTFHGGAHQNPHWRETI